MKKNSTLIFSVLFFLCSIPVFAEETGDEAEQKAQEVHKLANSDMIYSQEEIKALYYQNIQIIDLLKEIRDQLQLRANETKGEKS